MNPLKHMDIAYTGLPLSGGYQGYEPSRHP